MSFWGTIGTIGGAILAPYTGGASLAIGSALGQAADAASANKKAASQASAGQQQAAQVYAPYNTYGLAGTQALAQALGVQVDPSAFQGGTLASLSQPMSDADLRKSMSHGNYVKMMREQHPERYDDLTPPNSSGRMRTQPGTLADLGSAPQAAPSSYGQGTIELISPDGERRMFNAGMAEKLIAAGARRA